MPRPGAVHLFAVRRDQRPSAFELVAKAYRAIADRNRAGVERPDPLGELVGRTHPGGPELRPSGVVQRGERLAPFRVQHGEPGLGGVDAGRKRGQ